MLVSIPLLLLPVPAEHKWVSPVSPGSCMAVVYSFMSMQLLGTPVDKLARRQAYIGTPDLFLKHASSMLQVSAAGSAVPAGLLLGGKTACRWHPRCVPGQYQSLCCCPGASSVQQ